MTPLGQNQPNPEGGEYTGWTIISSTNKQHEKGAIVGCLNGFKTLITKKV